MKRESAVTLSPTAWGYRSSLRPAEAGQQEIVCYQVVLWGCHFTQRPLPVITVGVN